MVNRVMLIGVLGKKPELKYSNNGTGYSELRLALNSKRKQGNDYINHTDWVSVKVFGKIAENCVKYLDKGRQAFIEGKLSTNEYTNKEGKKVVSLDIIAENVQFLSGGQDKTTENNYRANSKNINDRRMFSEFTADDIPF